MDKNTVTRRAFIAAAPVALTAAVTGQATPQDQPHPAFRNAGLPNNPLHERVAVVLYALETAADEWLESLDDDDEGHLTEMSYVLGHLAELYASYAESDLRRFVDFEAKGRQLAALAAQLLKDRRPA